MADHTKIEWADATVNFWAGCTKVSPACDNCYAEKMAGRLWDLKWGPGERRQHFLGAVETLAKLDRKAQKLGTRLTVFINSLSDLFDNAVDDADRMDAFEAMAMFKHLVFLVLTKRIGNVAPYLQRDSLAFDLIGEGRVWLGITVCNQAEADRDIPKLLAVPAAKRFLSMEPLLGPVAIWPYTKPHCERHRGPLDADGKCEVCEGRGIWSLGDQLDETEKALIRPGIDWVIVGGESGPRARPMHPDWARSLRDQCQAAGVPFLFKQWGEWCPRGPEEWGYPCVDGVPRFRMTDTGDNGSDLAAGGGNDTWMNRAGKKAAGRLLDGVEHNGRPA